MDKEKFFNAYREHFGNLNQSQVDGLNSILDSSAGLIDCIEQLAYILATIKHETADTFQPIAEYGKGRGRPYGKRDPETGQIYYGRGYPQLTWRGNYAKMSKVVGVDLVKFPDLALHPDISFRILYAGMKDGLYTGHKLSDYITTEYYDFFHARKIINGLDQAKRIQDYADKFLLCLQA